MSFFANESDLKLRKFFEKVRMASERTSLIVRIHQVIEGVLAKNLEKLLLFEDFRKEFDSMYRRKMEQIVLTYGLPKETVTAITMFFKNPEVMVRSPNVDIDSFDIISRVLLEDTLAPYLFIISQNNVLQKSIKENNFKWKKARRGRYPSETMTILTT